MKKKKILIIAFLLLGYSNMAQHLYITDPKLHANLLKVKDSRADIILNDSIYGYERYSSSWFLDSKDYSNYNENGKLTERLFYGINDQYEWQLNRRYLYIWDDFDRWIEFLYQKINQYTLEFENYNYHYHFFNDNDLLVKDTILEWDNISENWVNGMAGNFSYNNENLLTNIIWNDWDSELENWKQSSHQLYNYQ